MPPEPSFVHEHVPQGLVSLGWLLLDVFVLVWRVAPALSCALPLGGTAPMVPEHAASDAARTKAANARPLELNDMLKHPLVGKMRRPHFGRPRYVPARRTFEAGLLAFAITMSLAFGECAASNSSSAGGASAPPSAPFHAKDGTVALHVGKPVDRAKCSGSSMSVGDTIAIGTTPDAEIADINTLWNANSVIGWLYLGNDGTRYLQFNVNTAAGRSAAMRVGIDAGSARDSGIDLWNGRLPPGTHVKKCFSKGKYLA